VSVGFPITRSPDPPIFLISSARFNQWQGVAFPILAIPAILAILAISSLSLLCNTSRNPFWFQGF